MKRFAANYLLGESGNLLKNGMLEADDSGNVLRILDTKGDLREISQLAFHNGILIGGFELVKAGIEGFGSDHPAYLPFPDVDRINLQNLVEAGKAFQEQFPEKMIRHFFAEADNFLIRSGKYRKIALPGVFLMIGCDLVNMKFTPKSRLKRLL